MQLAYSPLTSDGNETKMLRPRPVKHIDVGSQLGICVGGLTTEAPKAPRLRRGRVWGGVVEIFRTRQQLRICQ